MQTIFNFDFDTNEVRDEVGFLAHLAAKLVVFILQAVRDQIYRLAEVLDVEILIIGFARNAPISHQGIILRAVGNRVVGKAQIRFQVITVHTQVAHRTLLSVLGAVFNHPHIATEECFQIKPIVALLALDFVIAFVDLGVDSAIRDLQQTLLLVRGLNVIALTNGTGVTDQTLLEAVLDAIRQTYYSLDACVFAHIVFILALNASGDVSLLIIADAIFNGLHPIT